MMSSSGGSAYEVRYDTKAASILEKLPFALSERVIAKIEKARSDPLRFFKRLIGRREFSMRVGKLRVIADIDRTQKTIDILLLGHRKSVYR